VYHPFPKTYGDWWIRTQNFHNNGPGSPTTDDLYFTTGDTVVNALNYKKVNYISKGYATGPEPAINHFFTGGIYNFAYRNDSLNKKVYILLSDSIHETLWYNFNLNVGDTIKNTYSCVSGAPFQLKVTSIDSVLMCGTYYKSYACNCSGSLYESGGTQYLVESIGFTSSFLSINVGNSCTLEPYQIPQTNAWSLDACPDSLADINQLAANNYLKIYPNPAQNNFTVEVSTNEKQILNIVDVTGKLVLQQTINSKTTIDVSNLNAGVYNLNITGNAGVANTHLVLVK